MGQFSGEIYRIKLKLNNCWTQCNLEELLGPYTFHITRRLKEKLQLAEGGY